MKAAVFTLGCKVNQNESGAVAALLASVGFDAAEGLMPADLYIINTCSVTAEADKKSRQAVARALKLNPNAKIIIAGCSSQNCAEAYSDKPSVIAVFGTAGKSKNILDAATEFLNSVKNENETFNEISKKADNLKTDGQKAGNQKMISRKIFNQKTDSEGKDIFLLPKAYEEYSVAPRVSRTRAYIKIQDGCNNFCTYCIVPYLRGRSRSRELSSIVDEVRLIGGKTKEIVLTGIDISSYGRDSGSSLTALIRAINNDCKKVNTDTIAAISADTNGVFARLRLGSLECGVINEELLLSMKDAGFCDHFHISLQSGSESVLRRMNRHYSPREFLDKIELIRKIFPYAGITTDVIAGFPGETNAEHEETKRFLFDAMFSDLHVFAYSPRTGTKAYSMPQLDKKIREERAGEIGEIKNKLKADFIKKNLGRTLEVYGEKRDDSFVAGFTSNYIKVYTKSVKAGELKNVLLTQAFKDGAAGE